MDYGKEFRRYGIQYTPGGIHYGRSGSVQTKRVDPMNEWMARIADELYKQVAKNREGLLKLTREFISCYESFAGKFNSTRILVEVSEEFRTKFNQMLDNLSKTLKNCDAQSKPAESVMTDAEIAVALNKEPELIARCANPVSILSKNPGICTKSFVQGIESNNNLLLPEQLKQLRMAILKIQAEVSHDGADIVSRRPQISSWGRINHQAEQQEFFITYMLDPYDEDVCMKSVDSMPYSIAKIEPQSEKLQETALRSGFKKRLVLKQIYDGMVEPSQKIKDIYKAMQDVMGLLQPYRAPNALPDAEVLLNAQKYGIPTEILDALIKHQRVQANMNMALRGGLGRGPRTNG